MATLKWHSIRTKLNRCKLAFLEGDLISIDGDNGAIYPGSITAAAVADPYIEILRNRAAEQ
jgi:hypothetical protein